MYWHVITCTGWSWDQVDCDMDLPKLAALGKFHKQFPPIHKMIAEYLGVGSEPTPIKNTDAELDELMMLFPQTVK